MPDETLPEIWVRAHPFGDANSKDAHGEFFDAETEFYDDLLPAVPVNYYHSYTPEGKPSDKPVAIGIAAERQYKNPLTGEADGRWDKIKFFDNVSLDIKARIKNAIEAGTLRSSPSTVPDYHRVRDDGKITHWLSGNLAVFDASGNRQPANPRAIGIAEMKALYKAAHLEFPNSLMKGGGNPNHDDEGKFSSGGGSGGNASNYSAMSTADLHDMHKEFSAKAEKRISANESSQTVFSGEESKRVFDLIDASQSVARELEKRNDGGGRGAMDRVQELRQRASAVNSGKFGRNSQKANWQGVTMAQQKQNWLNQFVHTLKALFDTMPQTSVVETDDQENLSQWDEIFGKDETELETKTEEKPVVPQEETDMDEAKLAEIRAEYDNQMKAILDQNAALAQRVDRADIEKWIDTEVNKSDTGIKVPPAERDSVIALALNLKTSAHPTMKSADGKDTTLFDAFKKSIEARAPVIPLNGMKAAGFDTPQGADAPPSAERVNKLLKMTPLGEQVLKEKNGNGS